MEPTKIKKGNGKRGSKKLPSLDEFVEVINKTNGNLTNAGKMLGVTRVTIWMWANNNKEFENAIINSRKSLLDKCLTTAQVVALGIPKINDMGQVTGWEEKPDSNMLRYFISTLGKDEGFGEKLDVTTNNKDITTTLLNVDISQFSDEERKSLLSIARRMNEGN